MFNDHTVWLKVKTNDIFILRITADVYDISFGGDRNNARGIIFKWFSCKGMTIYCQSVCWPFLAVSTQQLCCN